MIRGEYKYLFSSKQKITSTYPSFSSYRSLMQHRDMQIRPLKYTDIDQYEQLTVASFGQHVDIVGEGEAEIRKQFRLMRFGRMVPFRILMSLSGDKSETLMCEQDGSIIGSATYSVKDERAVISGVMVAENFQNRGIGTRLVAACEAELKRFKIESIQANIAFENIASRRVFEKQGFDLFSHHRNFEGSIGITSGNDQQFKVRRIILSDEDSIEKLISQTIDDPKQVQKQARGFLRAIPPLTHLLGMFGGYRLYRGLVENSQEVCSAYQIETSKNQKLAHVRQLFVTDEAICNLPIILMAIAENYPPMNVWKLRLSILAQQHQLVQWLTEQADWKEYGGETVYRKEL